MITLATTEIENSNIQNQLFRNNGIFPRVYAEYLKAYCSDFLHNILAPARDIIENIKALSNECDNGNKLNDLISSFLEKMAHSMREAIYEMPSHFKTLIREIHRTASRVRDEVQAKNVLETLLFLRFIIPSLASVPCLPKKLQQLVRNCDGKVQITHVSDRDGSVFTAQETEFIYSVNLFYRDILHGPSQYGTSSKGIKKTEQDDSYNEMINVLKSELNVINRNYGDKFEDIFNLVKGKREITHINILGSANEMTEWMIKRESDLEMENKELKKNIQTLTKNCAILQKRIEKLKEMKNNA